ncbi:lytic transglycosylase domain-containing protein [Tenacibaculum sp. TC6]|uniref:lytic transglycosylase domain-containing protein n=1 Tax=Tenacibaculum sp. TC6 TaxID=3423223 RepID=UPI003D35FE40
MNKALRLLSIISITSIATLLVNTISKENEPEVKNVAESYEIKAVKLPDSMNLAGELVPLDRPDIRERMDRELLVNTYWQSNGLLLIKRAHKYFPVIEPLLAKYGLPDDFKYLSLAESGLMNVKSYAGAAGFWQFLKGTAREYGLEVNDNVDERYHLEKATRIAAEYLKKSKEKFGSWTLAAAAYNAGDGRISQRLNEQQVTNYFDLLLNEETSRYVFRILALKEIISNPTKYGFVFNQEDLYKPTKTYEVAIDTAITDIASFAKGFGVTYKDLKLENPWLRETNLNNKSRKLYFIKIPTK